MIGPQSIHKAYSYLFMTSSINSQQYVGAAFRLPRGFAGELKTKMPLIWVLSLSRVTPTQTHTYTCSHTSSCYCVCLALSDQGPGPLQAKKAIKRDWLVSYLLPLSETEVAKSLSSLRLPLLFRRKQTKAQGPRPLRKWKERPKERLLVLLFLEFFMKQIPPAIELINVISVIISQRISRN